MVKRSEELLKLLFVQGAIDDEEMELVWGCSRVDEATQLELYKVLNDVTLKMRESDMKFFIEQMAAKKPQEVIMEEVELVHEMGKRHRSGSSQFADLAVQFMWKLAFCREQKLSKQIVNKAGTALTDIIKNWVNDDKVKYFDLLISNLKQDYEGFLSIKMISRILKDFTGEPQKSPSPTISNEQPPELTSTQPPYPEDAKMQVD